MIFSWDNYYNLETPEIYLSDANKNYIANGALHAKRIKTNLYFNSISEVTFEALRYENNKSTLYYDQIEIGRLIEVKYIGWFQIINVRITGDGLNESKEITAYSLENEFCSKRLTSFGSLGTEDDEYGGFDRYCLYNPDDKEHSILHIIAAMTPSWKIGYVDYNIREVYRAFNVDEIDAYSFLTDNVSKTYECIFLFDTFGQTINAYKLEDYGKHTNLYFSYENLIKELKIECDASEIKTVFYVSGGDVRSTGTLNIIEVNPAGTNYIYDFSYYKNQMTKVLQDRLDDYETEYQNRLGDFTDKVTNIQSLYDQVTILQLKKPASENKPWSEYGLDALETEFNKYKHLLSQYNNYNYASNSNYIKEQYDKYYNILYGKAGKYEDSLEYAISQRKSEINALLGKIEAQKVLCNAITLNIREYLGEVLFEELSRYMFIQSYTDTSFIATDIMSESEILEMKRELFTQAKNQLAKISHPQYTFTIDTINFAAIPKFHVFAKELYLGDFATLEFGADVFIEERVLKIEIDWDTKDFQITFSSKDNLKDGSMLFQEIQDQAKSTSTTVSIGGLGWDSAKNKSSKFDEYIKGVLDMSLQKLQNANNQELTIENWGLMLRKWLDIQNDYSPKQLWAINNGIYLSDDGFRSVRMAIGEGTFNGEDVYGVWTDLLCGRFVLTKTLYIDNVDSTFTIDNNGFYATNGINKIYINPNNNNGLFEVYKNNDRKMYLNSDGDLWLSGNITASKIFSSYFQCSNGINTITIDPNNDECLFEITKGNEKQIYFDSEGNAVFEGYMTIGKIFSKNYIKDKSGTMIDLMDGKFESHGLYNGDWISYSKNHVITTFIEDGYIRIRSGEGHGDGNPDLFFTAYGISTGKDATNVTGAIEFLSKVYGDTYWGITIQTAGSPLGLRSKSSNVLIDPLAESTPDLFRFTIYDKKGALHFGDYKSNSYKSGIHFDTDKVYLTDSTLINGSGSLVCNKAEVFEAKINNLEISYGEMHGKKIATVTDLDSLETEWQGLLQTSYDKGYNTGYNRGWNAGYSAGSSS